MRLGWRGHTGAFEFDWVYPKFTSNVPYGLIERHCLSSFYSQFQRIIFFVYIHLFSVSIFHSGTETQWITWKVKIKRKFSYSTSETIFFSITGNGKKGVDSFKFLYVKNLKVCCSWNNFSSPRNCHLDSFLVVSQRFVTMTNQYNYISFWILKNIHTL